MPNIDFKGLCYFEAVDELDRMIPDAFKQRMEVLVGFDLIARTVGYYCTGDYRTIAPIHRDMMKEIRYSCVDCFREPMQRFINQLYTIQECYRNDNCSTYFLDNYSDIFNDTAHYRSLKYFVRAVSKHVLTNLQDVTN